MHYALAEERAWGPMALATGCLRAKRKRERKTNATAEANLHSPKARELDLKSVRCYSGGTELSCRGRICKISRRMLKVVYRDLNNGSEYKLYSAYTYTTKRS
jgi:hypothetical protein